MRSAPSAGRTSRSGVGEAAEEPGGAVAGLERRPRTVSIPVMGLSDRRSAVLYTTSPARSTALRRGAPPEQQRWPSPRRRRPDSVSNRPTPRARGAARRLHLEGRTLVGCPDCPQDLWTAGVFRSPTVGPPRPSAGHYPGPSRLGCVTWDGSTPGSPGASPATYRSMAGAVSTLPREVRRAYGRHHSLGCGLVGSPGGGAIGGPWAIRDWVDQTETCPRPTGRRTAERPCSLAWVFLTGNFDVVSVSAAASTGHDGPAHRPVVLESAPCSAPSRSTATSPGSSPDRRSQRAGGPLAPPLARRRGSTAGRRSVFPTSDDQQAGLVGGGGRGRRAGRRRARQLGRGKLSAGAPAPAGSWTPCAQLGAVPVRCAATTTAGPSSSTASSASGPTGTAWSRRRPRLPRRGRRQRCCRSRRSRRWGGQRGAARRRGSGVSPMRAFRFLRLGPGGPGLPTPGSSRAHPGGHAGGAGHGAGSVSPGHCAERPMLHPLASVWAGLWNGWRSRPRTRAGAHALAARRRTSRLEGVQCCSAASAVAPTRAFRQPAICCRWAVHRQGVVGRLRRRSAVRSA